MDRLGRCGSFAVAWGLLWATAYPVEVDAATVVTIETTIVASDVALLPIGVPAFWTPSPTTQPPPTKIRHRVAIS